MKKFTLEFSLLILSLFLCFSCKKDDETTLELSSDYIEIDSVGGFEIVSILTNKTWYANTEDSWITLSPNNTKENPQLTISAPNMNSSTDRYGFITVMAGNKIDTIVVVQSPRFKKIRNS